MNFDGVSPTQQYLIDNAVFYNGKTPMEAYEEIVGKPYTASIEPTQITIPDNVYMDSNTVVNSGDVREIPEVEKSWYDNTTQVDTEPNKGYFEEGLSNLTAPGSILDKVLQSAFLPYSMLRNAKGLFEEESRPGTMWETLDNIGSFFKSDPAGLLGNTSSSGLLDMNYDEGSYTETGGYSYGTIDDIGVETPN